MNLEKTQSKKAESMVDWQARLEEESTGNMEFFLMELGKSSKEGLNFC